MNKKKPKYSLVILLIKFFSTHNGKRKKISDIINQQEYQQIFITMPLLSSWYPKIRLPHSCYKSKSELGSSTSPPNLFLNNSQQQECQNSLFPTANQCQSVAAIVFGDGSSHSKLYPLTKRRSEAAIPIAGNYRLIDAVVSNCINSEISKIYAVTQFNSTSLNSHLSRAYAGARLSREGVVEVIAAYQSPEDNGWFQGTADAIRRCLWVLEEYPVVEFLVLPGHHLYKMDYRKLIDAHRRSKAWFLSSSFYDRDSPMYTLPRHLPPTLVTNAVITDSLYQES